jgi:hypothetical protein
LSPARRLNQLRAEFRVTQRRIAELFEPRAASIISTKLNFVFRYRSPEHWLDTFGSWYGPMPRTFAALSPVSQAAFRESILALIGQSHEPICPSHDDCQYTYSHVFGHYFSFAGMGIVPKTV